MANVIADAKRLRKSASRALRPVLARCLSLVLWPISRPIERLRRRQAEVAERVAQLEAKIESLSSLDARFLELSAGHADLDIRVERSFSATDFKVEQGLLALLDLARCSVSTAAIWSTTDAPTVGVIVPTCDRPEALAIALQSLKVQTSRPDRIIVVNDGVVPVEKVISQFDRDLEMVLLRTPTPRSGSAVARNMALSSLGTDIVSFLDDDNIMWPTWIEKLRIIFSDENSPPVVYGAQIRPVEGNFLNSVFWFIDGFDADRLSYENFIDINQLAHRKCYQRFDESLLRLADWDYARRLALHFANGVRATRAIASVYLSIGGEDRNSIEHWPPDLIELTRQHMSGEAPRYEEACHCSVCGHYGLFGPGPDSRPRAGCPTCDSLERHRFLTLAGPAIRQIWWPRRESRERLLLVEVAPSGATRSFRSLFSRAITMDIDPAADGRIVDMVASLTEMSFASESVDVLLALQVLEHIPADRKAMTEICRVLKPDGLAILQVPLSRELTTDEDPQANVADRIRRFGQADHVRLYGQDFFARLSEAGLCAISVSPRGTMSDWSIHKYALRPDEGLVFAARLSNLKSPPKLQRLSEILQKGGRQVRAL